MLSRFDPLLVLAVAVVVLAMCGCANAETWSAESDFVVSANPNGAWSYGWSSNLSSGYTFHLLPYYTILNYSPVIGLERRNPSTSSTEPGICRNPTSGTLSNWGVTWLPHTMSLHPGPNGEVCIVRWTAPVAGTYAISGDFRDVTGGYTTTDVHVLHNRVSLFDGLVQGGATQPFGLEITAAAGDTVDFAVGFGSNDTYMGDSTGLVASITPSGLTRTCMAPTSIGPAII